MSLLSDALKVPVRSSRAFNEPTAEEWELLIALLDGQITMKQFITAQEKGGKKKESPYFLAYRALRFLHATKRLNLKLASGNK